MRARYLCTLLWGGLVMIDACPLAAEAPTPGGAVAPVAPDAGRVLRLDYAGALARARRAPQGVLAALSEERARDARVQAAKAAFWPRMSLSASATLRHQELEEPPPATSGATQAYDASAIADLTLFDFGRRSKQVEAAEHERRAAFAGVGSARLRAQLAASEAYLRAVAAGRMADAFVGIIERRKTMLDATERLVAADMKPEVDIQRALLEVVAAQADLDSWRNRQRSEQAALAVAVGLPVEADMELLPLAADQLVVGDSPAQLIDAVACADPHVAAARARAHAAASIAEGSDRAVLPVVAVEVRAGYNRLAELYGSPAPPPYILSATSFEASAMLTVRWDGLDATLWHQADEAEYAAEAAERTLAQTSRDRELLAHQTALEVGNGRVRVAQQQRAVEVAREAFGVQDKRYGNGLASMLEILDAREALDEAEVRHVASQLDFDLARARLQLLTPACN